MKGNEALCSFIGLDLAWSDRNPSGLACVLFDGKRAALSATGCRTSDVEIIQWVEERANETTWIGIDAPIIAPNPPKTARPVDKLTTSLFGRFHAGVYPGNRVRCARPIGLYDKLCAKGYCPDPFLNGRGGRRQLEIFPHLVQITLLGRSRIVKYKKGGKEKKIQGLLELQELIIRFLPSLDRPLVFSGELDRLLRADPKELKGRQLKGLEDRIDAFLCAYMALYFWTWGEEKCQVFGDLESGYIIGPRSDRVKTAEPSQL